MRALVLAFAIAAGVATAPMAPPPAVCQWQRGGMLPDRACTPGAVLPAATLADICRRGYASSVRPSLAWERRTKRLVMQRYGLAGQSWRLYQLDHLVPLELGGAPMDVRNVWPEPIKLAHAKDALENQLHRDVCDGFMPLRRARRLIAWDWTAIP